MKTCLELFIGLCVFISVSADCGQTCASDEICNVNATACLCNPTAYTNTGSYPVPQVNCNGGNLNIFMSKCWLEKNGYNTSDISLQDPTCLATREIVNDTAQMVFHQPLINKLCNNTVDLSATHVTYGNALYIYGKSDLSMKVSCTFSLTMSVQLNITLKPILGTTSINVPGVYANFTVNMAVYKDSTFTSLLSDTDLLYVEDTVYISVFISDLDFSSFKVKVTNIYAFPGEAAIPKYSLLTNGCSDLDADQMTVISNGLGSESRFSMKVFQISGFLNVRLSADVIICTDNCATDCSSQVKSMDIQDNAVTVSVSLDAIEYYDLNSASSFSVAWTLSTLIFSWIFVMLI